MKCHMRMEGHEMGHQFGDIKFKSNCNPQSGLPFHIPHSDFAMC